MSRGKTAVLLMNVGSPDKPEPGAVRKYLTQFLNDPRVIDLPWLLRKFLVNAIIIPFRVKKSTGLYQRLWTENGSPLIWISREIRNKLQEMMDPEYTIFLGMRYGNPGYTEALSQIKKEGFDKLVLFPLFPQHAMSTTETAFAAVDQELKRQKMNLPVVRIGQFYNHPGFIKCFAEKIKEYEVEKIDHLVFTYHGLPDRQVEKCHPRIKVQVCNCTTSMPSHGEYCYRATCYETTRLIARELKLPESFYSTSFQSRLTNKWLSPFTDETLLSKIGEGKRNILVVAPSFVTDCLETIVEIGEDYRKHFREKGGENLQLVKSLNTDECWIEAMKNLILRVSKDSGVPNH